MQEAAAAGGEEAALGGFWFFRLAFGALAGRGLAWGMGGGRLFGAGQAGLLAAALVCGAELSCIWIQVFAYQTGKRPAAPVDAAKRAIKSGKICG